jgi:hypothetical protein
MRLLSLGICFVLWLAGACQADDHCGAEIKLLLVPTETHSVETAFKAGKSTTGSVYFFDTNALELLAQGVILRLRSGATSDLTVKLRPPANIADSGWLKGTKRYKCEVDVTGEAEAALRSYSIQTKFAGTLPQTGSQLFEHLSSAQRELLEQAHVSIDWARIKKIGEIRSTDWTIKGQSPFSKLVLELWEWKTGEILELSTKARGDAEASAYAQLRQMALNKGLSLNRDQKSKTALALKDLIRTPAE